MDVVSRAQLPSIVVAPRVYSVFSVSDIDEATAHCQVLDSRIKLSFELWAVYSRLEEWSDPLYKFDHTWISLVVLDEPVSATSTERPAPEQKISFSEDNQVLRMVSGQILQI